MGPFAAMKDESTNNRLSLKVNGPEALKPEYHANSSVRFEPMPKQRAF